MGDLFLIGEAGSGKSNTLERVILPIFSRTKVTAATQVTPFTLMRDSASSNLVPQPLDEFKPSKMDRMRLCALYNHFRDAYDGHEGQRGRADQTTVSYELLAPMVVAGEESPDESAIRERGIELLFSRKDLKPAERKAAFAALCSKSDALAALGRGLLEVALRTSVSDAARWHSEALEYFDKSLPSRVVNNLACCAAGLRLCERLCEMLGLNFNSIIELNLISCFDFLSFAAREYLLDGGTNNTSIVEQTFEVLARMGLDPQTEYALNEDGSVLSLWMNHVYDRYTKYRKDYAVVGEALTYAQFKKQLEHSDYFLAKNVQQWIGGQNRKVWQVNFALLAERCDVAGLENTMEPLGS